MSNEWKIEHLRRHGWTVTPIGKNIRATKEEQGQKRAYRGRVSVVHQEIFGY